MPAPRPQVSGSSPDFAKALRYYSTIRVSPVTQGGASFVEWWSTYDCEPEDEKAMDDLLAGALYAGGLAAVQARLG